MKIGEMPDAGLLSEMRKQFSYSLFIFMLTVSLVGALVSARFERLTASHVAFALTAFALMQAGIYLTFLKQSRELKRRLDRNK